MVVCLQCRYETAGIALTEYKAYVSGIEGDYNNVVGLPVGRLYQEVLAAGIDLRK